MATSETRAALDDWLANADRLLSEERDRCISPSSVTWNNDMDISTHTLADVERWLPEILQRLVDWPGRWIIIAEDAQCPHHFVQMLAFEDGSLVAECVSNYYLDGDELLSLQDEETLIQLGWEAPVPPRRTNWITIHPTFTPPVDEVAVRAVKTLRKVFGLGNEDAVLVKLFSSPLRGETPASPEVIKEIEPETTNASSRTYSRIDPDASDEELEAWAGGFVEAVLRYPVT